MLTEREAADLRRLRARKARASLLEFLRQAWPIVEPAMPLIEGWHLDAMCLHLEAVAHGKIQQLLINVPPGHAKSLLVAVIWPAWVWTWNPRWRAVFASYADDLAVRDSVRCRQIIESDWYQRSFVRGAWKLRGDSNRKDDFINTASGRRLSTSVGGKGTGERGDCIVVDDPLNATDARSEAARKSAVYWWDRTMSTRLNDPRKGSRVIIAQRLHEDDLPGHVLAQGGYEHLCLPSEYNPAKPCATSIWRDPRTEPGELLFPELFTREVLADLKIRLGSIGYAAQHDQMPVPEGGGMFQRSWWRFWKPDGTAPDIGPRPEGCSAAPARALPALQNVVVSVDATFKDGTKNDFVVMTVWGQHGADRFLLARWRGQWGFNDTCTKLQALCKAYPLAYRKLIEDKANGPAIIDALKSKVPGIVGVDPMGGKESRASAIQPMVEAGNVYLPDGAPWLDEWVAEWGAFPYGKHDDQVDSGSQALIYMMGSSAAAGLLAMVNAK